MAHSKYPCSVFLNPTEARAGVPKIQFHSESQQNVPISADQTTQQEEIHCWNMLRPSALSTYVEQIIHVSNQTIKTVLLYVLSGRLETPHRLNDGIPVHRVFIGCLYSVRETPRRGSAALRGVQRGSITAIAPIERIRICVKGHSTRFKTRNSPQGYPHIRRQNAALVAHVGCALQLPSLIAVINLRTVPTPTRNSFLIINMLDWTRVYLYVRARKKLTIEQLLNHGII